MVERSTEGNVDLYLICKTFNTPFYLHDRKMIGLSYRDNMNNFHSLIIACKM